MEKKIKVGVVNYMNAKPLLYGIENGAIASDIELIADYPSKVAHMLKDGSIDLGLVPVAVIPTIDNAQIIGDYGIAANGNVASVCIYSKVPLEAIQSIYLDYQSRTSVRLTTLLLEKYWNKKVFYLDAGEDYIQKIDGTTAGVIIGDRALEYRNHFDYVYDLAGTWKQFTGLPFVFAAWVANRPLPRDFIAGFNEANALGLENLDKVIALNPYPHYDLNIYYRDNIQYKISEEYQKGLQQFLNMIG